MRKIWKAAALAAGVSVFGVAGLAARAESLTDALIGAYRNSNLLEQNRALLRAADENVAQSVASLRPILNFVTSATARNPRLGDRVTISSGFSLEWLLYDFGATQLQTEAQKETVLATREALTDLEQQVLLTAVQAYMNYRRAVDAVALGENNVTLIRRELRAANDRFDVGEITRTDVAVARSRLATAQAALVTARGQVADAREFYRFAVGHPPSNLSRPPAPPQTAGSLEAARAIALRTHPQIKRAQHEVRASDLTVARTKAAMKPRVTLNANTSRDSNSNSSTSFGVQVGVPVYQGGAQSSRYRAAFAQAEAARSNLRQVTRTVGQEVANAWTSVQVARAQINASQQRIRAAEVAFRGIREEVTLGARTTLDVLDAEQELLDARNSLISAQSDEYVAIYSLLAAMGLLTVSHLGLGVETYDPAAYYNAVKDAPRTSVRGQQLDNVLRALGKKAN